MSQREIKREILKAEIMMAEIDNAIISEEAAKMYCRDHGLDKTEAMIDHIGLVIMAKRNLDGYLSRLQMQRVPAMSCC